MFGLLDRINEHLHFVKSRSLLVGARPVMWHISRCPQKPHMVKANLNISTDCYLIFIWSLLTNCWCDLVGTFRRITKVVSCQWVSGQWPGGSWGKLGRLGVASQRYGWATKGYQWTHKWLVMLVMLCDFPYFCIHFMYNFDPPIPIARTVPGALAPRNSPCWDSPGGWGIGKGPQIKTSDFLAPIAVVYFMFCMFCILYIGTNLVHTWPSSLLFQHGFTCGSWFPATCSLNTLEPWSNLINFTAFQMRLLKTSWTVQFLIPSSSERWVWEWCVVWAKTPWNPGTCCWVAGLIVSDWATSVSILQPEFARQGVGPKHLG